MRILVIDDDIELASMLKEFLEREGFAVQAEPDGPRGLKRAFEDKPDLIVLDVMLPGMDGFEILRRLREKTKTPVLMLTARGEDVDRIIGLELGADDYLGKPFNPRELAARIRAVLRRMERPASSAAGRLELNGVAIDPGSREVSVNGKRIEFTTLEFDILEMLMRGAGRVLSRDALMEALYGRKATPFDRSMDMHVSRIRKKLETEQPLIKTVRGVGYQFCRTPEESAD